MPASIKVIIGDDHQMFLDGLTEIVSKMDGVEVVATATDGENVMLQLEKAACDLAILDVHMPVLDGLETSRLIRKKYPRVKVLVLTMNNEFSLIKHVLEAGALGYILKTNSKQELERAIRKVAAGLTYFSDAVAEELARQYMPKVELPQQHAFILSSSLLSEREKEIVALVAREYSSIEIGNMLFIAPTTVDTHRKNVMHKLGVKNLAGLVKYALKAGLVD